MTAQEQLYNIVGQLSIMALMLFGGIGLTGAWRGTWYHVAAPLALALGVGLNLVSGVLGDLPYGLLVFLTLLLGMSLALASIRWLEIKQSQALRRSVNFRR